MTGLAEVLAKYLAGIFVSYDKELLELTTLAIRIYSVAYLFNGLNIFTSSFFTALNNGAVSAAVSFLRMFVFQIAMIMILPLILGINGIWMAVIAAELLARPLSMIFVSYDTELLEMTTYAFAVYSISFFVSGYNIYASSFFTALNDGFTSATISFGRTLIFQVICVLVLPILFGPYGIWYAVIAAEIFALILSIFFLMRNRKKYGYI